jgi:Uma2 family endonuclease
MLSIDAWLDEKPYKELYDGVVHEKVSPQLNHGQLAGQLWALFQEWSCSRGVVAVEVRVYLDEGVTLVPDVAFFFEERLAALSREQRQKPPFAPDIAVEVRSPEDRAESIKRKTKLYLAYGATLVLDVDPADRTVVVSDASSEITLRPGDTVAHAAFPDLRIPVAAIFAPLDRKM